MCIRDRYGDFRSKSLTLSDWNQASDAYNNLNKPTVPVNSLGNLMIDWGKISNEELTVHDLWKAANGDTTIPIPNLQYAFNLLTTSDPSETKFHDLLSDYDSSPTTVSEAIKEVAEKKAIASRMDPVFNRQFYKSFALDVDFQKIQEIDLGLLDYYLSLIHI